MFRHTIASALLLLLATISPVSEQAQAQQDRMMAAFNAGRQLSSQHDYDAAATRFEEAIRLSRTVLGRGERGDTHLQTAMLMEHKANALFAAFRKVEARDAYEQALKVASREPGTEAAALARTLEGNLGNVAKRFGDWDRAEQYFKKTISRDSNPQSRAVNQLNLGWLYYRANKVSDADRAFSDSLRVWTGLQTKSAQLNQAACLHGQAMIALKRKQYPRALELFREAYSIRKTKLESNHRFIGHSLEMIGVTLSLLGRNADGLQHLEQAVTTLQSFWGPAHEEVAEAKHELALALARKGDLASSIQAMSASRRGYRRYTAATLVGLEQQAQLQFLKIEKHRAMDGLALATQDSSNAAARRTAWEWHMNNKGFSFEVLAQQRLLARSERSNDNEASAVRRLKEVRRKLVMVANSKRRAESSSLNAEETRLTKRLGIGGQFGIGSWATADDVQSRIPRGTVLLDFAFIDRKMPSDSAFGAQPGDTHPGRYVVWIVTRDSIRFVELGDAEAIDAAIVGVRDAIDGAAEFFRQRRFRRARILVDEKLKQLSQLLLTPLEEQLASTDHLLLSPDGALWLLPWPALITNDGQYLVEKLETSCVVSARQLLGRQAQQPRDYGVIMANPDYGLNPSDVQAELRKAKVRDDMFPTRTMQVKGAEKSVLRNAIPLPGTQEEARTAKPLIDKLTGGRTYVYTQEQALESFAKVIQRPKIAVFATHGFLLEDDGSTHPLARSGLVFAGVNHRIQGSDRDDGILTALEVLDCDFRGTQLIMLSACDTALGHNQVGEGIAGLQQAFHLAGAEQVFATLWPIADRETQLLMKNFWENLADGKPARKAMRQAQLDYIENVKQRLGYPHPWLWAGPMLTSYSK